MKRKLICAISGLLILTSAFMVLGGCSNKTKNEEATENLSEESTQKSHDNPYVSTIDDEIAEVEAKEAEIDNNQDDASSLKYNLWNDELTKVLGYLKEVMDEDSYSDFEEEQKEWEEDREKSIDDMISGLDENNIEVDTDKMKDETAYSFTKDRVKALAEKLKEV